MGKHTGLHGFVPQQIHESGEDTTLAAVMLEPGLWDRTDTWTPLDEVVRIEEESLEMDPGDLRQGVVLLPVEEYDRLMALAERLGVPVDRKTHQVARPGWVLLKDGAVGHLVRAAKLNTLRALLRFVWGNADHLWGAIRNLLAMTHKFAPDFIRGMSGADIARLLGLKRATVNKHEIKLVEEYLERWGISPVHGAGGSKGDEHRKKKSEQMKGRRHRAADYEPVAEPGRKLTKRQYEHLAQQAEQTRLDGIVPGRGMKGNGETTGDETAD